MCGIVGLFAKSPDLEERLGVHLVAMLAQMSDRGPDSAGVAIYRDPSPDARDKQDFDGLNNQPKWKPLSADAGRVWTDDYSSILRALTMR